MFARLATAATRFAGKPATFFLAVGLVSLWAAFGPWFEWSDSHSLFINTATTIVTFLMVFLIQNTQNRDGAAIQAKLDELVRASPASNRFVGLDHLTDEEIEALRERCEADAKAEPEPVEPSAPIAWNPWVKRWL